MNHMLKLQESLTNIRDALKDWQCSRRISHMRSMDAIEQTQLIAVIILMFIAKLFESLIPPALDLGIWIAFSIAVIFWSVRRIFRRAY